MTGSTTPTTFDRLRPIIADALGREETVVTPDAEFHDDLGADSLDTLDLVMWIEEEFGVAVPDDAAEKVITVADAVALIDRMVAERP